MSKILSLVRLVTFAWAILSAIVVLGLFAHLQSTSSGTVDFLGLGIAVSVLTLVTLPAMLIVDMLRAGATTSAVWAELAVTGVLWVLWLATAALTTSWRSDSWGNLSCSTLDYYGLKSLCNELTAGQAFAFLAWLCLFGYFLTVLVFAIMRAQKGGRPWTTSVRELGAGGPVATTAPVAAAYAAEPKMAPSPAVQQQQYPPQAQQPYAPQAPSTTAYSGAPAPGAHPGYGQV